MDISLRQRIMELPKQLADKIAAGEVVERPLSIVKELVENSIDAGADFITVEIRHGGKTYIRVTDNGCGFDTRHPHTGNGKRRSVGMANIAERMELNGGEFRIFSRIGWGTCAKIIIKGEMKA